MVVLRRVGLAEDFDVLGARAEDGDWTKRHA
jgi:hypothetical protein